MLETVRRDTMARRSTSQDRKSTRLNSSHLGISYAVFCLKKKNTLVKSLQLGISKACFGSLEKNRLIGAMRGSCELDVLVVLMGGLCEEPQHGYVLVTASK